MTYVCIDKYIYTHVTSFSPHLPAGIVGVLQRRESESRDDNDTENSAHPDLSVLMSGNTVMNNDVLEDAADIDAQIQSQA